MGTALRPSLAKLWREDPSRDAALLDRTIAQFTDATADLTAAQALVGMLRGQR